MKTLLSLLFTFTINPVSPLAIQKHVNETNISSIVTNIAKENETNINFENIYNSTIKELENKNVVYNVYENTTFKICNSNNELTYIWYEDDHGASMQNYYEAEIARNVFDILVYPVMISVDSYLLQNNSTKISATEAFNTLEQIKNVVMYSENSLYKKNGSFLNEIKDWNVSDIQQEWNNKNLVSTFFKYQYIDYDYINEKNIISKPDNQMSYDERSTHNYGINNVEDSLNFKNSFNISFNNTFNYYLQYAFLFNLNEFVFSNPNNYDFTYNL